MIDRCLWCLASVDVPPYQAGICDVGHGLG